MEKLRARLSESQLALHGDVFLRIGHIAATSLECVLLDGAKRFIGISPHEEAFVRQLAKIHKVQLPI